MRFGVRLLQLCCGHGDGGSMVCSISPVFLFRMLAVIVPVSNCNLSHGNALHFMLLRCNYLCMCSPLRLVRVRLRLRVDLLLVLAVCLHSCLLRVGRISKRRCSCCVCSLNRSLLLC